MPKKKKKPKNWLIRLEQAGKKSKNPLNPFSPNFGLDHPKITKPFDKFVQPKVDWAKSKLRKKDRKAQAGLK